MAVLFEFMCVNCSITPRMVGVRERAVQVKGDQADVPLPGSGRLLAALRLAARRDPGRRLRCAFNHQGLCGVSTLIAEHASRPA